MRPSSPVPNTEDGENKSGQRTIAFLDAILAGRLLADRLSLATIGEPRLDYLPG